ncbi:MAG: hypothetical protein ACTHNU_08015 [Gaiellales bacterium]
MHHGRKPARTRMLTCAIAGVCACIGAGAVSAAAAGSGGHTAGPSLLVKPGVRGLSAPSQPLAPGDTVQRTATLVNAGTSRIGALTAVVADRSSSPLADGLQTRIDSCPVAWKASGEAIVCPQAATELVGWQPVAGPPVKLLGAAGLKPGAALQLRLSVRLSATAGNAYSGLGASLSWAFTAG